MSKENLFTTLEKSPVFAMSLGSKELFHSNVWAWMIKKYPQYATVFFKDINVDMIDTRKIKREQGNRDLTIHIKNADDVYVIENKFKSYPDKDQLEKYTEKLKGKLVKGCLTYMIPPVFDEIEKWNHLSYEKLCEDIQSLSVTDIDPFDKAVIDEYCKVLDNLIQVLSFGEVGNDNDTFTFVAPSNYKNLRIHDVYSKIMCNRFMQYYTKNCQKDSVGEYSFICEPDYSNQNANLTIKYQRGDEGGDMTAIGIQIQGNDIRHFVEITKNGCNVTQKKDDLFKGFTKDWFDEDFDQAQKEISLLGETYKTNMNPKPENQGKYNAFKDKNNNGIFIYQHYNVPTNYTYKDAAECFDKTLQYVFDEDLLTRLDQVYKELN